jgi:hypothetical protein
MSKESGFFKSTEPFRCIVAGSRTFDDYEHLEATLNLLLCLKDKVQIVSGGANGADKLGERYAKENGHEFKLFPADWDKHGKAAGPIRNEEMAKNADGCVVFWDGKSKGTKNMIDVAKRYNLKLHIEPMLNRITERKDAQ